MLRLNKIVKDYYVAGEAVHALKGIDLNFRPQEFVSILGPSGCGKTTLLNIIGGLDQYTSGDLIIAGRSTKEFKDSDWDSYRNHRIGFVFQSYNLIPHQNILSNVELALTISGMSKQERIKKAKNALDRVGLKGQYNKKPNQLSGGQCQRVAIARAIVNDPEILLADEPTGALDSETSIQIMDIIKEISKERLVIMVTHNPDLAIKYSTRIVKLLDGTLTDDTNPYSENEEIEEIQSNKALEEEKREKEKSRKVKMSLWTAIKLSAKNLYTKFKRTALVVVAGSIGIIGVASVLSISTGVTDYIESIQDDLLSGNPILIQTSGLDVSAIMNNASTGEQVEALKQGNFVNIKSMIDYLVQHEDVLQPTSNNYDMNYVKYVKSMPKEYYNDIKLNYGIDIYPYIYTDFAGFSDAYNKTMSLNSITNYYTEVFKKVLKEEEKDKADLINMLASPVNQGITSNDYISAQYEILAGHLPENDHELILVLDSENALTDLSLAQLGFIGEREFYNWIYSSNYRDMKNLYDEDSVIRTITFEDILNKKYYFCSNDKIIINEEMVLGGDLGLNHYDYRYYLDDPEAEADAVLQISAIVKPKSGVSYGTLDTGLYYTEGFAREMISYNINSKIVEYAKAHDNTVNSGNFLTVDYGITYDLDFEYEIYDDKTDTKSFGTDTSTIYLNSQSSNSGILQTAISYIMRLMGGDSDSLASGGSGTLTLNNIAGTYLPVKIAVFPINFDNKDLVTSYLDKWNDAYDGGKTVTFYNYQDDFSDYNDSNVEVVYYHPTEQIKYADNVELIVGMINRLIMIVTTALIIFTSISLVVSTVMIGIITYVSVVERVKEIGVIRSLGGRKIDVSNLFNVEAFIIGFCSGVFGMLMTILISIIINIIVKFKSSGAISMIAHVTVKHFLLMVLLSVLLTAISGIVPALSAARKNPVDALRTE